ncbi:trehalose-phosphatase [Methylocystis sp. WRRC1]|uniref:trehalose-phosphatase n=1 Tax=Methylocystis sp. WRRC1 TaxID=1732014 RepID=UPI001D13BFD2|nr:trehalose-phosphatase [Methylocystis sp. WRRC1]MCC3244732.1 trehalose-phosphatase [Methylocystis sp. WRRC1]
MTSTIDSGAGIESGRLAAKAQAVARERSRWALFLDFDGTLVEIGESPSAIVVPTHLPLLLARLNAALDGAFAIVTGRPVSDIDRFLAPFRPTVAGVHGAEIRAPGGRRVEVAAGPKQRKLVAGVRALCRRFHGVSLEFKPGTVAVHYRANPEAGPPLKTGLQQIVNESPGDLVICSGRMVHEILPRRVSKGAAIETLAELPAFRGCRPLVIGDDVTDESAFAAAVRLGGVALKVAGEHFPPEDADFDDPAQLRSWLDLLAANLGA